MTKDDDRDGAQAMLGLGRREFMKVLGAGIRVLKGDAKSGTGK